jgi:molybdate transport system substrate-binding protein
MVLIIFVLAACTDSQEQPQTLTVFAASSLTDAFEEIAATYEKEHPQVEVRFNFAATGTLATQISEGAKADVFASANEQQMTRLQEAGLLTSQPQTFARNRLVLLVWQAVDIQSLHDLTLQGIHIVTAAPDVPIRAYTDEVLAKLESSPEYGIEFSAAVRRNTASEEANVRQVVLKVALGEADAGFVYASDVTPDIVEEVRVIPIPDEFNVVASYPLAAVSENPWASDFIAYVRSAEGQAILSKWGLLPAP